MFGYITVNKPELKIKDFETYRGFYCGLCQNLKKEQGRLGQIALNYDMLFIVLLLSGLYEPTNKEKKHRCFLHPFHKQNIIQNEVSSYASDMTIVLAYYKSEDDWNDERDYTKLLYKRLLKNKINKLNQKYPSKIENIKSCLYEINRLEKEDNKDIDTLSSLFGKVMEEVITYKEDIWQKEVREVGNYLGRFVYLLDAYEDIEEDIKKNLFNPLTNKYKEENFDSWMQEILETMMAKCSEAYSMLPIVEYSRILDNILYLGVWNKFFMVKKMRLDKNGSV